MTMPIRQGDVFLIPVAKLPGKLTEVPRSGNRVVLALGEATGHAHAIADREATLLTDAENIRFLRIVGSGARVEHEEHASIFIPPGDYRVVLGREWSDELGARQVVD